MIVPIVLYGQPVLREKAPDVTDPTASEVQQLVADLIDTMIAAGHGIGLAATQIGVLSQVAVIDLRGVKDRPSQMWIGDQSTDMEKHMPLVLINPQIKFGKSRELDTEGCLSIPHVWAEVERPEKIKVKTQTLDGKAFAFEANGLLARAIQHEVDHLNGKLFIDLLSKEERDELKPELDAIQGSAWLPTP
jgi:peptide deformylase